MALFTSPVALLVSSLGWAQVASVRWAVLFLAVIAHVSESTDGLAGV